MNAPYQLYDTETLHFFWWQQGTLFHAQRGGLDPSVVYTSTDLRDALEQAGYDRVLDNGVVHANDSPEDFEDF